MFQKIDVYGDVFFYVLRREFYLRMMYTFSNTSQKNDYVPTTPQFRPYSCRNTRKRVQNALNTQLGPQSNSLTESPCHKSTDDESESDSDADDFHSCADFLEFNETDREKNSSEFLLDFVSETIELCKNGFMYKGRNHRFKVDGFICDAPARSFILCVKGHSGYFGCTKCIEQGEYIGNIG